MFCGNLSNSLSNEMMTSSNVNELKKPGPYHIFKPNLAIAAPKKLPGFNKAQSKII